MSEIRRWAEDVTAASSRVGPLVETVTQKVAADIERTGKLNAPYRTGNLKNSIGHTIDRGDGYIEAEVGPTAAYGYYVEEGTSRQAPQPYMGPAFDMHHPKLQQALEAIVERSM